MNNKTKADLMRELQISRMPIQVQIMAGKIFDAAHEAGREEGFSEGVRKGAESAMDKLEQAYSQGMTDANRVSSASFRACAALALHELYGFAAVRSQRVVDRIAEKLVMTLHPSQWADERRKIGVIIDDIDVLQEWSAEEVV